MAASTPAKSDSTPKTFYTTANPFEIKFGYHRAVRKGPFIFVSGTTALKFDYEDTEDQVSNAGDTEEQGDERTKSENEKEYDGKNDRGVQEESRGKSKVHHPHDAGKQARLVMERCVDAVKNLGGRRDDVVRVRMFVARHEDCLAVGEAYRGSFGSQATRVSDKPEMPSQIDTLSPTQKEMQAKETRQKEADRDIGAAATMIVVGPNGFVDPDILVEIEVDAVVA